METGREKRKNVREKIKVNVTNFSWVQETRGFGNDNFLCEKHSFFFGVKQREGERY
jgi:hypothetical protein